MPKDDRTRSFPPSGGPRRPPARDEVRIPTPREIYEHLDRYVIGQTSAKRAVATAAHQHLKRIEQRRQGKATLLRKSNLLLMGPTGSEAQGRRSDTLPRARGADAGADMSGTSGSAAGSTTTTSPSQDTSGSASGSASGSSSSDTTKK